MRHSACTAAAALAVLSVLAETSVAAAHGSFPQVQRILFSPADPNRVVAGSTYGILSSADDGVTWSYLCEDAVGLGPSAQEDPGIALTGNGSLVASTNFPGGVSVSRDDGCSWSCAGGPLAGLSVPAVVARPDAPHSVVALTSTEGSDDAGDLTYATGVFESTDDGATWRSLGVPATDPGFVASSIGVAKSDPLRIYVSGRRGYGADLKWSVYTSKDGGATWSETRLATPDLFDPANEGRVYVAGVDPTDADRVYLRTAALPEAGRTRLAMSTDGGATFRVVHSFDVPTPMNSANYLTGESLGFALSPDGSKIYAGTGEQGLWVAARADLAFHMTSPVGISCLAARGDELWVCSNVATTYEHLGHQFVLGVTKDDGATFTPKMISWTCLTGPLACPTGAPASLACGATLGGGQCGDSYHAFCDPYAGDTNTICHCGEGGMPSAFEQGADGGHDAGRDVAAIADPTAPPAGSSAASARATGSGCSFEHDGGSGTGTLAAIGLAVAALAGRRTRRR